LNPILKVERLSKHFLLHMRGVRVPSCDGVNLEVHSGRLTALTGPTGSGKSSVLKCIYRTYLPSAGQILFRNGNEDIVDMASASEHTVLELRRRDIAFVTQFLHCLPRKSALDVVAAPLYDQGVSQKRGRDCAAELLSRLSVPERLWDLPPATFSGGEKQRVNLARGLIARPRLLLLDEPTASLDPLTSERVVQLINHMKSEGMAMLAIFHHPELVAKLADNVIKLASPSDGNLAPEASL
jgi:alpha-D-ribose 1-methylphosphonate 5-triphosphate synthase subunit PhnL